MVEIKFGKILSSNDRRLVLGDVTNQLGNRGFSLVTRNPACKPLVGVKRSLESIDVDSRLCRKIVRNKVRLSPLKGGKTYRLQSGLRNTGCRNVVVEVKKQKQSCSALDSIVLAEDRNLVNAVNVESAAKAGGQGKETESVSDAGELGALVSSYSGKSSGDDCLTSTQSDSFETLRFTESQKTRSFGLERCKLVKGDGSDSFDAGIDLLKNCSCSFCTKAAYMWSDLLWQDVKGRISTLAKSRRETSNWAQKYSKETPIQPNSSMAPRAETDLTTLWSSHFLHMDSIFAAETSQLQSNLAVLKDLREGYKMNLETINALPPNMQQCTSDVSDHMIS